MVDMSKDNGDLEMILLTEREHKMLARLKDDAPLSWVSVGPEDVKTLNRLVKKGMAIMTVGNAGGKSWSPVFTDRDSNL